MKNTYIKVKSASGETPVEDWVRPEDWLTLPELIAGEQKVVGLHAVWGDSDFAAVLCNGAYTVDWGDGTVENIASGVKAEHLFNYSALAGTECSDGYRQAIVTITPQTGETLTSVDFQQKHSQSNLPAYAAGWLDIGIVGSSISSLSIGGNTCRMSDLFSFLFRGSNLLTSLSSLFSNCHKLQSVSFDYTSAVTNTSSMFYSCYSLRTVTLFDTSSVTNMNSMFYSCLSLRILPLFDTSLVINMAAMFRACQSLITIPLFNTSSVTAMPNMFFACYSLKAIPQINTSSVTDMSNMFAGCSSLQTIPQLNTSLVINFQNMFQNCNSLPTIPSLDTGNATNNSNMFYGCYSLQRAKCNGTKANVSYLNCKLSATELEAIFDGLATVSSATITITGNWGTSLLTAAQLAIATNKGWTVTT